MTRLSAEFYLSEVLCCTLQVEITLQHSHQGQEDWKKQKKEEDGSCKSSSCQHKTTIAAIVHQLNQKQSTHFPCFVAAWTLEYKAAKH